MKLPSHHHLTHTCASKCVCLSVHCTSHGGHACQCSHQSPQRTPGSTSHPQSGWGSQGHARGRTGWAAGATVPPSSAGLPGAEAAMARKGPRNPLGASRASTSVWGLGGGCKAGGPGATPVTPTLLSLRRLDNVHGSRVEPSETARMNSMDRHIQQTNDRLQCIKQVGACRAHSSAGTGSRDAGCPVAAHLGPRMEVMVDMGRLPGAT